jgi:hypothetical protein
MQVSQARSDSGFFIEQPSPGMFRQQPHSFQIADTSGEFTGHERAAR